MRRTLSGISRQHLAIYDVDHGDVPAALPGIDQRFPHPAVIGRGGGGQRWLAKRLRDILTRRAHRDFVR